MNVSLIYHHDDPDGHVACGILYNYLKTATDDEIVTIPKNYNQLFDEWEFIDKYLDSDKIKGCKDFKLSIYLTDLSFTNDTISTFDKFCANAYSSTTKVNIEPVKLVWVDHHESSSKVFDKVNDIITSNFGNGSGALFSNDLCGAALTWAYVKALEEGYDKVPDIINRSGDNEIVTHRSIYGVEETSVFKMPFGLVCLDAYDRWTKKEKYADAWVTGLKFDGYEFSPDNTLYRYQPYDDTNEISAISDTSTKRFINNGNMLLAYQKNLYMEESDRIGFWRIGKFKVAYKNALGNSWNFNDALKKPINEGGSHYGILGAFDPTVGKFRYSIYRNETLDNSSGVNCSKMAESLGGGGHAGAAGFASTKCIFGFANGEIAAFLNANCKDNGKAFGIDYANLVFI